VTRLCADVNACLEHSPTFLQQAIRATFYMVQFGAGYMLMLLAMYYNGYILIFGIFVRLRDNIAFLA